MLWVPLVVVGLFAFGSGRAEAEQALTSWYGPGFSGLPTASGEPYDPFGYTAAHKTMPLGTELLVSYGGNSVEVTVNDRGPYVGERELDLSQGAAEAIGLTQAGVDYVEYTQAGQYASTDQYAATSSNTSTVQYASTTQDNSGTVSTSQSAVYDSQYSTGSEPLVTEQYAVAEAPVEEPAPVVTDSVSVPAPDYYPPDDVTSSTASSILVVQPGETLSELALETGFSVEYLASQNAISDPNYIYSGQVLYY